MGIRGPNGATGPPTHVGGYMQRVDWVHPPNSGEGQTKRRSDRSEFNLQVDFLLFLFVLNNAIPAVEKCVKESN